MMKFLRAIKALFRIAYLLVRHGPALFRFFRSDLRDTAAQKADRLDRLRNPHKYGVED